MEFRRRLQSHATLDGSHRFHADPYVGRCCYSDQPAPFLEKCHLLEGAFALMGMLGAGRMEVRCSKGKSACILKKIPRRPVVQAQTYMSSRNGTLVALESQGHTRQTCR